MVTDTMMWLRNDGSRWRQMIFISPVLASRQPSRTLPRARAAERDHASARQRWIPSQGMLVRELVHGRQQLWQLTSVTSGMTLRRS